MLNNYRFKSYHVGVAAEAFVAAIFSRLGYDISVQYGANQPEYDLIIAKDDKLLKVSVKGSKDGAWGLLAKYKNKDTSYHQATDMWLTKHKKKTVMCFVQFDDVEWSQMPRMYLATPTEVSSHLKSCNGGTGTTTLHEMKVYSNRSKAYGTTDLLPNIWTLTKERIDDLLNQYG